MAKDFAKQFYSSKQWQTTREAYAKSKRYLCENCLRNGIITTGEIVHHITPVTPDNIEDASITLNESNLELLCRKCHGATHGSRRYAILPDGTVSPLSEKNY